MRVVGLPRRSLGSIAVLLETSCKVKWKGWDRVSVPEKLKGTSWSCGSISDCRKRWVWVSQDMVNFPLRF